MRQWIVAAGVIVVLGYLASGCATDDVQYADPISYCAAVGTVDRPDGRYVGLKSPAWLPEALKRAIKAPSNLSAQSLRPIVWRCADGAVLACSFALGVPCDEKAATSHIPSEAALSFCRTAPEGAEVPPRIEGGASIFLWRCQGAWPHIVGQRDKVDAQGFPTRFWFRVVPANVFSA